MHIREVQRRAWANKVRKGFNTTDPVREIEYIRAEVTEAADALNGDLAGFGGELADIVIFVAGLAEMTGVDLCAAVQEKLAVNERRVYVTNANGFRVKVPGAVVETVSGPAGDPSLSETFFAQDGDAR